MKCLVRYAQGGSSSLTPHEYQKSKPCLSEIRARWSTLPRSPGRLRHQRQYSWTRKLLKPTNGSPRASSFRPPPQNHLIGARDRGLLRVAGHVHHPLHRAGPYAARGLPASRSSRPYRCRKHGR